jgi:lysophospholipase L1-like esterase
MHEKKNTLFSVLLVVVSVLVCIGAAELILRLKNSAMATYDIEMWRYAKELKQPSPDANLSFEHVKSRSAVLQNVQIRLNELGLRGDSVQLAASGERHILFLGGSITLGWGISEEETVSLQLEKMLRQSGEQASVLNGGVGNYNAARYVSRFLKDLTMLDLTDIVVQYFLRDAEDLQPDQGNVVLRHSELAVTSWMAYHRLFDEAGEKSLVEHYRKVYRPDAPGFLRMTQMLGKLAEYANSRNIRLYMLMTPDIHNLVDYKFGFVHDAMRQVAKDTGYVFVDSLPSLLGRPPQELFAMPGDPHPNALGHRLMAEAIFPVISRKATTEVKQ